MRKFCSGVAVVVCLAGLPALLALTDRGPVAAEATRRVLVLNSFGRDFAPYRSIVSAFRTELARLSPAPVDFLEVSLETVRFEKLSQTLLDAGEADQFATALSGADEARRRLQLKTLLFGMGETFRVLLQRK